LWSQPSIRDYTAAVQGAGADYAGLQKASHHRKTDRRVTQ